MKGSKEMKNIIIGVLITVLSCAGALAGCGVVQDKEVDYPTGDKTPEHVAEVLGSYSRYEQLQDSKLRKPTKDSMQIVYDTVGRDRRKVAWVSLVMMGEIVKIEGRVITISNEGEIISLYLPEFAEIDASKGWEVTKEGEVIWEGSETAFEQLKVGDWLWHISVVINADDAQARVIHVGGISP